MSALGRRLMGGWTELHVAAAAGDLARVRMAVQKNPSDVDKTTRQERQTALHLAAANGFEAVVGELLDRQARTTVQDEAGRTPLHVAAIAGRTRCIAVLLSSRNREPPAERARLLSLRDRDGRDALMAAVVAGQGPAVEEMLRGGADAARCTDQSGAGVVIVAVQCGHVHLLPLLVPSCGLEQRHPTSGGTPLHVAAAQGNLPAVEWLLRAGANTTTRDNAGQTAVEAARAAGQAAVCRLLRDGAAGSAGGGGAVATAPAVAQSGGSANGHDLYAPPTAAVPAAAAPVPAAAGPAAGFAGPGYSWPGYGQGMAVPPQVPPVLWQQGAAPQVVAGPEVAGGGPARLQVPQQAPAPVLYPPAPEGAGVYY